jgi:hypothetical protein
MKCLLLVMGMVGCGGGDEAPPSGEAALPTTPNDSQAKVDEPLAQTVDISKWAKGGGLMYEGDGETPFTRVAVAKYTNGKKKSEATVKDGKHCVALAVLNEFLKAKRVKELSHADG